MKLAVRFGHHRLGFALELGEDFEVSRGGLV